MKKKSFIQSVAILSVLSIGNMNVFSEISGGAPEAEFKSYKNIFKVITPEATSVHADADKKTSPVSFLEPDSYVKVLAFANGFYKVSYQNAHNGQMTLGWVEMGAIRNTQLTDISSQLVSDKNMYLSKLNPKTANGCYQDLRQLFLNSSFEFSYWLIPNEEINLNHVNIKDTYIQATAYFKRAGTDEEKTMADLQYDLQLGKLWQISDTGSDLLTVKAADTQRLQTCLSGQPIQLTTQVEISKPVDDRTGTDENSTTAIQNEINDSGKYRVVAEGRTYFYQREDNEFVKTSVFIIQGDEIELYSRQNEFSEIRYTNIQGKVFEGYVLTENIRPIDETSN